MSEKPLLSGSGALFSNASENSVCVGIRETVCPSSVFFDTKISRKKLRRSVSCFTVNWILGYVLR